MAVKGLGNHIDVISCYVYNILSQHADSVHSIDVSLHADSAHSIDVSQHGDIAHSIDVSQDADSALPARGRPFTHQTLAREDVLRIRDRAAISEYVVSYTLGTYMLEHNNIYYRRRSNTLRQT